MHRSAKCNIRFHGNEKPIIKYREFFHISMSYISAINERIASKFIPVMQVNMVNAQKSNDLEMSRSITSKTMNITFWAITLEPEVVETSGWLQNIPWRNTYRGCRLHCEVRFGVFVSRKILFYLHFFLQQMANSQKSNNLEMSRSWSNTSKTMNITFWAITLEPEVVETSGWLWHVTSKQYIFVMFSSKHQGNNKSVSMSNIKVKGQGKRSKSNVKDQGQVHSASCATWRKRKH